MSTIDRSLDRREEFPFNWLGLPACRKALSLLEAADAIPAFIRRPFQIDRGVPASTVNPYYEIIVRLPTDAEPTEVPVGLVSRHYQLIQHLEILQRAATIIASLGIDLNQIDVNLDLTIHGERMRLGLLLPKDSEYSVTVRKGDIMALYLEFVNSVDGSLRMSLRVSWLRLICLNGLVVREVQSDFSRPHVSAQILAELADHLPSALKSVLDEKKLFNHWMAIVVGDGAFENWIEDTVRKTWGLKAAVRAYHIARRGVDVEVERMVRGRPANSMPIEDRVCVIGSITSSLNVFAITQAMTWLAGDRAELQEQLDWKSQVYPMVMKLVPAVGQRSMF
jgi:Domain of unknown function (DUF932)